MVAGCCVSRRAHPMSGGVIDRRLGLMTDVTEVGLVQRVTASARAECDLANQIVPKSLSDYNIGHAHPRGHVCPRVTVDPALKGIEKLYFASTLRLQRPKTSCGPIGHDGLQGYTGRNHKHLKIKRNIILSVEPLGNAIIPREAISLLP